jgi:hypothetical protein
VDEPIDPRTLAEIAELIQNGRLTQVEWTTEELVEVVARLAGHIIDLTESIRSVSTVAFAAARAIETLANRIDEIEEER